MPSRDLTGSHAVCQKAQLQRCRSGGNCNRFSVRSRPMPLKQKLLRDAATLTTHTYAHVHTHTHMKVISSTSYVWTHVCSGTASTSSPLSPPPPQTPGNCYHIFSPSSCLSFPAGLDLLLMLTLVLSSGFRLLLFPEKLYKKVRRFFEARHNIYTREEDLFSFLFFKRPSWSTHPPCCRSLP